MFISISSLLCSLIPTANAARFQARVALSAGEYGQAADCYMTAAERLGNRVLSPFRSQPLFSDGLLACASAAFRAAVIANGTTDGRPVIERLKKFDDLELRNLVMPDSVHGLGHHFLTPGERLLLVLDRPLAAPSLLPDLVAGAEKLFFEPGKPDSKIRRLFRLHYYSALAAQGNTKALRYLGQMAIHSNRALRALSQLEEAGIEGAGEQTSMVQSERHTMFLADQERERQRLEDEIQMLRGYLRMPLG